MVGKTNEWLLFAITLLTLFGLIKLLQKARLFQHIYELGPASHQRKMPTPSLGGLALTISLFAGLAMWQPWTHQALWVASAWILFALIGLVDDTTALKRARNKGFSAKSKFAWQVLATLLLLALHQVAISPMSPGMLALSAFVFLATSNATNLTDGLDGLLGGLGFISLFGFFHACLVKGYMDLAELCKIVMIILAAFLVMNHRPAKIYMGDTGSLALGALLAALAITIGNPFILIPLGAVYILETLSVIIQVAYFKQTRKRIFLMAPLHHHFEALGLSEWQTVFLFWSIGGGFLSYFLYTLYL